MNRRAMTKLDPALRAAFAITLSGLLLACEVPAPPPIAGTDIAGTPIGGAFTLTGKDGQTVTWDQFKGQYRIVYFGYTFCPDVCPVDVAVMMQGFAQFAKAHPDRAAKVQPIFITIDPARDTPAVVGEFAAAFSPKLIGLTGSQAQIDGAIKAFRAYAARGKESAGGYLMDHSRNAYLMGPDGAPIEVLPVDKGPAAVAGDLAISVK
jgi:protein SCO1